MNKKWRRRYLEVNHQFGHIGLDAVRQEFFDEGMDGGVTDAEEVVLKLALGQGLIQPTNLQSGCPSPR